jgi:hypothetical protein
MAEQVSLRVPAQDLPFPSKFLRFGVLVARRFEAAMAMGLNLPGKTADGESRNWQRAGL